MPANERFLDTLSAGQRLLITASIGTVTGLLAARSHPLTVALLVGWCTFAALSLVAAAVSFGPSGRGPTQRSLERNDQSMTAILLLVLLGCAVSVTAIVALLLSTRGLPLAKRWPHGVLSLATIILTWLLIHVRFAFHYAHRNLQSSFDQRPGSALEFPGDGTPDYFDYMYFSFVIGMTSQVSDVTVHDGRMRRLVLGHSLLSFGFNLLILALAVNALAALVQ